MNGKSIFITQRVTAIFQLGFLVYVFWVLAIHQDVIGYVFWKDFMGQNHIRIFSSLFIFSLTQHALLGLWVILTDYVHLTLLRRALLMMVGLGFSYSLIEALICLWR